MPDLDADAIANAALEGKSVTTDGQSSEAFAPSEQVEALRTVQGATAAAGTNRQGGPRSGWNMMRPSRAVTEGA